MKAAALIHARTRVGLTQMKASAMLVVNVTTWRRWESGRGKMPWAASRLFTILTAKMPVVIAGPGPEDDSVRPAKGVR